jgi:capsular polysaccharide biosynthesis protein
MRIRIRIREQLCLIIAVTALLSLMVLSVAVYVQSHRYMTHTRAQTLEVTASLKADQLAQDLALFNDAVITMTTRENLQAFIKAYNSGNTSNELRNGVAVSSLDDVSTVHLLTQPSLTSSMLSQVAPRTPLTCKPPFIRVLPRTTQTIR